MIRMSSARNLAVAVLATALFGLARPSQAGDFYLYGDLGDAGELDLTYVRTSKESHSGVRFGYGAGYRFGNGVGVELSKNKLGEEFQYFQLSPDINDRTREFSELDSLGLFATYRYQPKPIGLFGGVRLGVHRWTRHVATPDIDRQRYLVYTHSETDPAVGIELGYQWRKHWSAALTWTSYVVDEHNDGRIAARVEYHFD